MNFTQSTLLNKSTRLASAAIQAAGAGVPGLTIKDYLNAAILFEGFVVDSGTNGHIFGVVKRWNKQSVTQINQAHDELRALAAGRKRFVLNETQFNSFVEKYGHVITAAVSERVTNSADCRFETSTGDPRLDSLYAFTTYWIFGNVKSKGMENVVAFLSLNPLLKARYTALATLYAGGGAAGSYPK